MKYHHLTIEEREKIQLMWWKREPIRAMALELNRSPSSISRELRKNFPQQRNEYTPRLAHEKALVNRKRRGREDRLKNNIIRKYVVDHLKEGWSPEQISGRMKRDNIGKISHEAIYQYVYVQIHRDGYGYLRPGCEDLRSCLRRKKKRRTPKGMRRCQRMLKPKGLSIDERPLVVAEKKRIGDWEGDTVESMDHKPGVNTLLERMTGMFFVTKLESKTSSATSSAIVSRLNQLPDKVKCTITFDNGSENSGWRTIEEATGVKTFFAHPYHSWERGANENTNGLLREYFPKKTDFSMISEETIKEVEFLLNSRPRKRLGYLTPLEAWGVALDD